jgi:hypothetical protein
MVACLNQNLLAGSLENTRERMDKLAAHREVGSYPGRGLCRIGAEPTVPGRSAEGGVARSRHHRGRRPPVWTPGDTLVSDLRLATQPARPSTRRQDNHIQLNQPRGAGL